MSPADPRLRAMLRLAPVIPVYTPGSVDEAVAVAQALLDGGLPVIEVTLRTPVALEAIAAIVQAVPDAVVGAGTVLNGAQLEAVKAAGGRFAVIGYGSLGGNELGFGSDLDLVFLHDQPPGCEGSDGRRPLDPGRYYARLAQKMMSLLGAVTAGGRLYDTDVRLRPDGGKGALVSSLASYTEYQRERAWTWDHQALVRARAVAGDPGLMADFTAVRAATLGRQRDWATLVEDVVRMRARLRAELDRSDAARLDLKQGAGGVVDLEFLLQTGVLALAATQPSLLAQTSSQALIDALGQVGWLDAASVAGLHRAHAILLDSGLGCTLDRRPRIVARTPAIEQAGAAIAAACVRVGLMLSEPPAAG